MWQSDIPPGSLSGLHKHLCSHFIRPVVCCSSVGLAWAWPKSMRIPIPESRPKEYTQVGHAVPITKGRSSKRCQAKPCQHFSGYYTGVACITSTYNSLTTAKLWARPVFMRWALNPIYKGRHICEVCAGARETNNCDQEIQLIPLKNTWFYKTPSLILMSSLVPISWQKFLS